MCLQKTDTQTKILPDLETELFCEYYQMVYFFCKKHLWDKTIIEDAAQEILAIVIKKIRSSEIKKKDSLASFIYGVSKKICLNANRKHMRNRKAISMDQDDSYLNLSDENDIDLNKKHDIEKFVTELGNCMKKLKDIDYNIIILSFYEKLSNKLIAQKYETTQTNVGVRKKRALYSLRLCLNEKGMNPSSISFSTF